MTIQEKIMALSRILGEARNQDELAILLEGMLTPPELDELAVRWQVMEELSSGRKTQREIAQELGISLGTISRGSRLLKYGPPEFRELFERIRAAVATDDTSS